MESFAVPVTIFNKRWLTGDNERASGLNFQTDFNCKVASFANLLDSTNFIR